MKKTYSYQILVRFTALLLLLGIALPTGLHAKYLVDFCLIPVKENSHMLPDHSCCPSEAEDEHTESHDATHSQCDTDLICSCHIDEIPLNEQQWITSNNSYSGILSALTVMSLEDHTDNFPKPEILSDTYSTPPIFLLNSTFLN